MLNAEILFCYQSCTLQMHAIPFGAARYKSNETIANHSSALNAPAAGIDSDAGAFLRACAALKK